MIIPFMGFFLVSGLGHDPWVISLYSLFVISVTLITNRQFARRIDAGGRVFPLVGIAASGFAVSAMTLSVVANLWTVLTIGVIGFGISTSAISTMFSLGGNLAEVNGVLRSRFNAYMRATTSTAWMIGPAVTFLIADQINVFAVFRLALALAVLWLYLWWVVLPHDITAASTAAPLSDGNARSTSRELWLATAFVFCLSSAHSLTFTALPLFYVTEVGLPGYAPGTAFSIKTFVEVLAIFSTPMLIARFGMRRALLATSLLAVVTIQLIASVETFAQMMLGAALEGLYYGLYASLGISYIQSFAADRPAQATAIYWNTLMVSGLLAGPLVGLLAQAYNFEMVVRVASGVALFATVVLFTGGWWRQVSE